MKLVKERKQKPTCTCNLFMYAGSFLAGNLSCIYCAVKELFIIVVLLALVNSILDDQPYLLQHLEH